MTAPTYSEEIAAQDHPDFEGRLRYRLEIAHLHVDDARIETAADLCVKIWRSTGSIGDALVWGFAMIGALLPEKWYEKLP